MKNSMLVSAVLVAVYCAVGAFAITVADRRLGYPNLLALPVIFSSSLLLFPVQAGAVLKRWAVLKLIILAAVGIVGSYLGNALAYSDEPLGGAITALLFGGIMNAVIVFAYTALLRLLNAARA